MREASQTRVIVQNNDKQRTDLSGGDQRFMSFPPTLLHRQNIKAYDLSGFGDLLPGLGGWPLGQADDGWPAATPRPRGF